METYRGTTHFDLGTRWKSVVRLTPQSLYLRRKGTPGSLNRRLGGLQNWSGRFGGK